MSIFWHRWASWKNVESIPGLYSSFPFMYDTLYPDPPKVSLEAAIEWWKITAAPENASPKSSLEQFDETCEQTKSCNKVSKFLGMYSSNRLYTDWCMAVPEEKTKNTQWCDFVKAMTPYYKPTE